MHQSAGEVRNRYVLLSRLRKPNTYSLSKCSARNSLGATTPDWFKKQQVSMKTTNRRFAWPRGWTLNFTGAQKWHIGIKYHFIREQVENGNVELTYCRTDGMVADMLAKSLGREQLRKLRKMSGLDEMPSCSTCEWEGVLRKCWVLCYDYLFISRTQLENDVMFSRTFYDKTRTG